MTSKIVPISSDDDNHISKAMKCAFDGYNNLESSDKPNFLKLILNDLKIENIDVLKVDRVAMPEDIGDNER